MNLSKVDSYASSYGQESLWQPNGLSAINVPAVVRVTDPRQVPDALNVLCARHDAFRTVLARDADGVLRQQVVRTGWLDLYTVDHRASEREALPAILLAGAERPFHVDGGPLAFAELHSFAGAESLLVVWLHHAVSDLASSQVVADDLRHLLRGTDPGPVRYQMSAFGEAERAVTLSAGLARYWQEAVAGADRDIGLPRPAGKMHRNIRPALPRLSVAQVDALMLLATEQRTTITAVLMAAMVACHAPEAIAERVLVGLTKSNRDHPRLRSAVGCLADQLPLVVNVGGNPTFADFVGRVRESMIDAFDHRAPLGTLRPLLGPRQTPVFALNLNFLPTRPGQESDVDFPAGLVKSRPDPWWLGEAVVDYRPRIDSRGMGGEIEGDAYVHDPETVAWFGERFVALLETVAEVPGLRLSELTATVRAR